MKPLRLLIVASLMFAAAGGTRARAIEPVPEYEVKAAFLLSFVRFIQWPDAAFTDARSAVTVCVFGANPFGDALQKTLAGETAAGRPLVLSEAHTAGELAACHLVFVTPPDEGRALQLLSQTKNWAVTVGESRRFLALGGAVTLFLEGTRLRFGVNLRPVEHRSVRLNARMLQLASRVDGADIAP